MNTYLKILVKLILINILFINPINSKTLPPGTGGEADVPANVLIMLDVSGSMNNRTTVGINYNLFQLLFCCSYYLIRPA